MSGGGEDAAKPLIDELLGPLHIHFSAARQAYRDYLEGGRSFLFACSLRRTNEGARALLLSKGHLLPAERQEDALALVRHYDAWMTLWDLHREATRPGPGDPFVFENDVTYPAEAEARIEALYAEISGRS